MAVSTELTLFKTFDRRTGRKAWCASTETIQKFEEEAINVHGYVQLRTRSPIRSGSHLQDNDYLSVVNGDGEIYADQVEDDEDVIMVQYFDL